LRNPVWLDLRTGMVYQIPEGTCTNQGGSTLIRALPVYDSPVVITSSHDFLDFGF
jgi:hypothetical protein